MNLLIGWLNTLGMNRLVARDVSFDISINRLYLGKRDT